MILVVDACPHIMNNLLIYLREYKGTEALGCVDENKAIELLCSNHFKSAMIDCSLHSDFERVVIKAKEMGVDLILTTTGNNGLTLKDKYGIDKILSKPFNLEEMDIFLDL